MGTVYRAEDPLLLRTVALKLLRAPAGTAAEQLLTEEAQAMARLSHPNVVALHEVGVSVGRPFLAMEWVAGPTLHEWLAARPSSRSKSTDEILGVFMQAGAGLEAAHRAGIVHRDFKPQNVLIGDDGRAKVSDFGLAHVLETGSRGGAHVGTPAYMSPEQLAGAPADERSDQFAYCVALYEALVGRRPFAGVTAGELAVSIAVGPPSGAPRRVPRRVMAALRRGLAANPADRHPSMAALLSELEPAPASWWRSARAIAFANLILALAASVPISQRALVCRGSDKLAHCLWYGAYATPPPNADTLTISPAVEAAVRQRYWGFRNRAELHKHVAPAGARTADTYPLTIRVPDLKNGFTDTLLVECERTAGGKLDPNRGPHTFWVMRHLIAQHTTRLLGPFQP
jgi:hypothetical protein